MTDTLACIDYLFEGTTGDITLYAPGGELVTSSDNTALAAFAEEHPNAHVDLVTHLGEQVGHVFPGNTRALTPELSITLSTGGVYLFTGASMTEGKVGTHLCPPRELAKPDNLIRYNPGALAVKTPASDTAITLMQGRRRDEGQGRWKETNSTFGQFSAFLQKHKEGPKDGPCFLQGQSAGGARKAAAMIRNFILGVDLDSGAPLADVMSPDGDLSLSPDRQPHARRA